MIDEHSFKSGWNAAMFIAELWVARNFGGTAEESLGKANELCFDLERYYGEMLKEAKELDAA